MTIQEAQLDLGWPGGVWIALGKDGQEELKGHIVRGARDHLREMGHEAFEHYAIKVDVDEINDQVIVRLILFFDDEGGPEPPIDPDLLD